MTQSFSPSILRMVLSKMIRLRRRGNQICPSKVVRSIDRMTIAASEDEELKKV